MADQSLVDGTGALLSPGTLGPFTLVSSIHISEIAEHRLDAFIKWHFDVKLAN